MPSSLGRVLIVDDEPHVAAMLEEAVTTFGYAAHVAPNGQEALRVAAEFHPDVVLLDLTLPDISGDVVLGQLREAQPELPIIMVTGNSDVDRARRTLAQGAFDYIAKPFDLTRLAQVLEAAIAHRGA
jgi:DNA-binding response OmpR family regulator